ncbi:MAG: HPF/RaiA family ribosome-associated protein [Desulfurivibrio sp.]|nr:HPF/RaiA family ribosome-associated protein [Desulfurivibrio sp.]MBU4151245.1 HPF/RaiA family ribosome-associated protein [Pseudomonadota bacterium]MDP2105290.1 HPF/RaiA family ribosome-associated protein [Desulfobulbaceae bacterium]
MSLDVNWSVLGRNDKSKGFVSRRLSFLVGRFRSAIMRVRVHFSDVNGPKGGVDKQCVVSVKLWGSGEITVKGQGTEYLAVFQSSFEKLVRSLRRELAKQRDKPIRITRREHMKLEGAYEVD